MRIRRKKGTREKILQYKNILVAEGHENKGKWAEYFGNDHAIHLEIGSGFGQFILTLAQKNPEINYIGIEKVEEVLIKTIQRADQLQLKNIRFLWVDAEDLPDIFASGEIAQIYLNFSDPWPKKRHAKRRLTHGNFLNKYKNILQAEGKVNFKTDCLELFEFSLNEFVEHGWKLRNICLDVTARGPEDNIQTEYEEKFSQLGIKINRCEAYRP